MPRSAGSIQSMKACLCSDQPRAPPISNDGADLPYEGTGYVYLSIYDQPSHNLTRRPRLNPRLDGILRKSIRPKNSNHATAQTYRATVGVGRFDDLRRQAVTR